MRFGSPAITARGMGKAEVRTIARWVTRVIANISDLNLKQEICQEVKHLCSRFPVPGIDF
jgi:glycine hydroxymethyltransferase